MSNPNLVPTPGIDVNGHAYVRNKNPDKGAPAGALGIGTKSRVAAAPISAVSPAQASSPEVVAALAADLDAYDPDGDLSGGEFLESRGWRVDPDDFRTLHEILMESDYIGEGDSSRGGWEGGYPADRFPPNLPTRLVAEFLESEGVHKDAAASGGDGDWRPGVVLDDGYVTAKVSLDGEDFPAEIAPERWNGFAIPRFDRATAQRVVDEVNRESEGNPDADILKWDGDTVVVHSPVYADDEDYEDERIEPDARGMYPIGGWSWTWMKVAEDD